MRINDVLRHRQSDAGSLDACGRGGAAAHEFAQNVMLFRRGDSHAAVAHADVPTARATRRLSDISLL